MYCPARSGWVVHESSVLGRGTCVASHQRVFASPISGARCISALEALGYRMIERCGSCLVLRRPDQKIALVPDCTIVHPVVIEALLAEANVSWDRFVSLLDEPVTVAG